MSIKINCYFCFEDFDFYIETPNFRGIMSEIWDCSVCCSPNLIKFKVNASGLTILDVSDGNE